jgi:hypothetical protein
LPAFHPMNVAQLKEEWWRCNRCWWLKRSPTAESSYPWGLSIYSFSTAAFVFCNLSSEGHNHSRAWAKKRKQTC